MDKKFFNIIASGSTATIFLYGDIGDSSYYDVRSMDISRELKEAESAYKKIDVRINSNGGEVYAGIAIFNALRNSNADIHIYVDGIAASMASVIALCGKPVQMSKYARLMLHSVSGGCYGTKGDLKEVIEQIESLEGSLCDMYARKTGMTADEIRTAYFDGKDHYLNANEALSAGFIDGIYDAEPVPEDSTPEQIYQIFNNRLHKPQIKNQMNIEDLRKRPLFKDAATDDDVLRIVGHLETEAGKVPGLSQQVTDLNTRLKVFEDKAKADADAAKKNLLDAAEADGRINAQTRPVYQALLDKDLENGTAALNAIPAKKRVVNHLNNGGTPTAGAWEKRQEEIRNQLKK
ncbi:MAG: Clp protease ClpP [Dysgonamonadaceae bacterium]|jgi:ATP-dependent Clp endopeptidase proteolytic subunit ClpP|nr:Clp protease ClpP [Dysgonamonadaceae bacterium]